MAFLYVELYFSPCGVRYIRGLLYIHLLLYQKFYCISLMPEAIRNENHITSEKSPFQAIGQSLHDAKHALCKVVNLHDTLIILKPFLAISDTRASGNQLS